MSRDSKYALLDTSRKEIKWFSPNYYGKQAPLRLLDVKEKRAVTILTIPVDSNIRDNEFWNNLNTIDKNRYRKKSKDRVLTSWRCDVHPAWSRDYQWVALNSRANNGNRQVLVAYIGNMIK